MYKLSDQVEGMRYGNPTKRHHTFYTPFHIAERNGILMHEDPLPSRMKVSIYPPWISATMISVNNFSAYKIKLNRYVRI